MSIFDPVEPLPPGLEIEPIRSCDVGQYKAPALLIALPLCALCLLGLASMRFVPRHEDPSSAELVHSIPIALDLIEQAPVAQSLTVRDDMDSPGFGEGHIAGSDTVDPALPRPPEQLGDGINVLPNLLTPETPLDTLPDTPQRTSYRTDLPKAPGGNGAASGTGRDTGRGGERLSALHPGAKRPDSIYPVYRVKPIYATEKIERNRTGVLVKLMLDAEGRVITAEAQNGLEKYHKVCVEAARQWLFHIPPQSQAEAPFTYYIHFELNTGE